MWFMGFRVEGSVVVVCGLSYPVACGILVPRPETEPPSPALEGTYLTTGPHRKSLSMYFFPLGKDDGMSMHVSFFPHNLNFFSSYRPSNSRVGLQLQLSESGVVSR